METLKCGIDGGNSTIVTVIEGKKMKPYFPSICATATNVDYKLDKKTRKLNHCLHVEVESNQQIQEFLFGYMAEDFPESQRNRENADKCTDYDLINWQFTALSFNLWRYGIENNMFSKSEKNLNFDIELGVSLPFHEAIIEKKQEIYCQQFYGDHIVRFKHPLFENLVVKICVKRVVVNIEGESPVISVINKPDSLYLNTDPIYLLDSVLTWIDIGGYSTEIIGVQFIQDKESEADYEEFETSDIQIVPVTKSNLTKGIQKGVGTIMNGTIKYITNNYADNIRRTLTRRDIEKALAYEHDGKKGWILPEFINIADSFSKESANFGKELAKDLINIYSNANVMSKVREIYISGGGSKIPDITVPFINEMKNRGFNTDHIFLDEDPIYSNALANYESLI